MLSCYTTSYHITVYHYTICFTILYHIVIMYTLGQNGQMTNSDVHWNSSPSHELSSFDLSNRLIEAFWDRMQPHHVSPEEGSPWRSVDCRLHQFHPLGPSWTSTCRVKKMGNSPTILMPESLPLIFWSHDFTRDTCLCEASSWVLPLQEVPCRAPLKCVNSSGKTFLSTNMTNTGSFQLQPNHSSFQQTANSRPLLIQHYSWSRLTTTLFSSWLLFYYVLKM